MIVNGFFVFEGAGAGGRVPVIRRVRILRGRTLWRQVVPCGARSYLVAPGRTLEGLQGTTARVWVRRREERYDRVHPGTTARAARAAARRRASRPDAFSSGPGRAGISEGWNRMQEEDSPF